MLAGEKVQELDGCDTERRIGGPKRRRVNLQRGMAPRVTPTDARFPALQRRRRARKEQGVFDFARVFVVAPREAEQERGLQFILDGGAKEVGLESRRLS